MTVEQSWPGELGRPNGWKGRYRREELSLKTARAIASLEKSHLSVRDEKRCQTRKWESWTVVGTGNRMSQDTWRSATRAEQNPREQWESLTGIYHAICTARCSAHQFSPILTTAWMVGIIFLIATPLFIITVNGMIQCITCLKYNEKKLDNIKINFLIKL